MLKIRALREAAGLSQSELARQMGVAQPSVLLWEQGRNYPTADKLPRLAQVLGVEISELYDVAGESA